MRWAGFQALALVMVVCAAPAEQPPPLPMASPSVGVFPFVRTCDSAVSGTPNMRHAVNIGPLTLIGTTQRLSPSTFQPHDGRYAAIKILAIVTSSTDVTVTVPLRERASEFLLYDPAVRGNRDGFTIAEADAQVRLDACPGPYPKYNGGLLLKQPGCVELEVESKEWGLVTGSFPVGTRSPC